MQVTDIPPLALCNAHGEMRSRTKSEFCDVMVNIIPTSNTQCPLINSSSSNDCEFLFMLHQPPPPDMTTHFLITPNTYGTNS